MKKYFLLAILQIVSSFAKAQEFVAPNVKTAQIKVAGADFGYPICILGQSLELEFDVLDDNYSDLAYSIRHCDCNFKPDDLTFNEFAEGFDDRDIDNFQNSFNTHQSFTHYTLEIPNDDITLTISGNYIVNVYESGNPENVILTKRFMVCEEEDNSKLSVEIQRPMISEYSFNYQQVRVSFNNEILRLSNPSKYLKVFAMQNDDLGSRKELEISGFLNNEIQYFKNDGNNLFQGGSEYEYFDAKDVNFRALGIDEIYFDKGLYNYKLTPFVPISASYTSLEDLNGRYYIKNDRGFNRDLESDYINVNFRLKYSPFVEGKIYVTGELSNYIYDETNELDYNRESGYWETQLTLKQGLYNYQYVIKDNNGKTIEYPCGSWYNTENEYFISVYTTLLQNRGDRLIMYKVVNSTK